jgi:putative redox protein
MSVHVRSAHEGSFSVGWTGQHSLVIDRSPEDGGTGLGFDGGQLLLLAIGANYANDLFREAEQRGMELLGVRVVVECDWAGDPVRAQNVRLSTRVEAEAPEEEVMGLIHDVDRIAEVHNSLRHGTEVTLCDAQAVSMQIEARSI